MPSPTPDHRYRALEQVALGVTVLRLLASLASRRVFWDPVFDTAFLVGATYLVVSGVARPVGTDSAESGRLTGATFVAIYLVVDAGLRVLTGSLALVWLLLAGLYGAALAIRLRNRGLPLGQLPWAGLFRRPALFVTLGALVPLACLYLPMFTVIERVDTGFRYPMIAPVGQVITVAESPATHVNTPVTLRGVEVDWSRAAALLLAGIVIAQLLRLAGLVDERRSWQAMRGAVAAVLAWWLIVASGFRSLGMVTDLVFVAATVALMVWLVSRDGASAQR